MKNRIIIAVLLAVVITFVALFVLTGCSNSSSTSGQGGSNLDGKALLESRCTACHSIGRVTSKRSDLQGWTTTVQRMVANGAQLTAAEQVTLEQYLADTYK